MEKNNETIIALQKTVSASANTWTNIEGFVLPPIVESGNYDICSLVSCQGDNDADVTSFRIAITNGGVTRYIKGMIPYFRPESATGTWPITLIVWGIKLEINDVVSIQAKYSGTSTAFNFSQGTNEGSIQMRRVS